MILKDTPPLFTNFLSILLFSMLAISVLSLSGCDKESNKKPAADVINIADARIRAMPPGHNMTAMFMTLNNPSLDKYKLVKVDSDASEHVELHEHVMKDGMMQMGQVKAIDIGVQGNTQLKPGGYHVMFIGLKQDLTVGQKVPVTLTFKDGSTITIDTEVKTIETSN